VAGGSRKRADAALLAALAGGATVRAAARKGAVSESTVYRRLRDREFRARVTEARAAMVERALGRTADGI
jgi:transposase